MLDCTGGDGCHGGDPADVWLHVATVGGADSSASYPYVSGITKTVNTNIRNWEKIARQFAMLIYRRIRLAITILQM